MEMGDGTFTWHPLRPPNLQDPPSETFPELLRRSSLLRGDYMCTNYQGSDLSHVHPPALTNELIIGSKLLLGERHCYVQGRFGCTSSYRSEDMRPMVEYSGCLVMVCQLEVSMLIGHP